MIIFAQITLKVFIIQMNLQIIRRKEPGITEKSNRMRRYKTFSIVHVNAQIGFCVDFLFRSKTYQVF